MYRPRNLRIMSGTDIGTWEETIPDTCYRNNFGWLICRSRGKRNGGRIAGSRFYVIARDGNRYPHKIRTNAGSVRYFDSAPAAAIAAVKYSIEKRKAWEQSKLVSDVEALVIQKKQLLLDVEHLNKTKASLQSYVSRLNGDKTRLSSVIKFLRGNKQTLEGAPGRSDNNLPEEASSPESSEVTWPAFMLKAVTHIVRQGKPH